MGLSLAYYPAMAGCARGSLGVAGAGVAGVGELYGLPRSLTLPLTASALLAIVASGAHRRAKRAAIAIVKRRDRLFFDPSGDDSSDIAAFLYRDGRDAGERLAGWLRVIGQITDNK